jgi:hypothetical protein
MWNRIRQGEVDTSHVHFKVLVSCGVSYMYYGTVSSHTT